jgi:uncharacterized RDD family membrane protein YckC
MYMDTKKIYTIIAAVFAVTYSYNLFWFFRSLIEFGSFGFQFTFFIRYVPVFLGIAGLVIFITSQFKRSNLLRVIMCLEIMSFPFLAFWYIQFFSKTYGPLNQPAQLNWTFYVGCAINAALFFSSIIGLRKLSFNKTAKLSFITYGAESTAQFFPASANQRFVNRLVDGVIIIYILLINLASINISSGWGNDFQPEIILLIQLPFLILYYIILEGIFNTTAGKCATGTTIVNEHGQRPGFAQILGRTFCRIIPFEPFSFFRAGSRGWHDTLTNTYVVESVNQEDSGIDEIIFDAELTNPTL